MEALVFAFKVSNLEPRGGLSSYRTPSSKAYTTSLVRGQSLHTRVWREEELVPAITAGTKYLHKVDEQWSAAQKCHFDKI